MVVHNLNNSSDEEDSPEKGSLSGEDQATAAVGETGGPSNLMKNVNVTKVNIYYCEQLKKY